MQHTLNLSKSELKAKLKSFRDKGLTDIKLNLSFDKLEKEYARVMQQLPDASFDYAKETNNIASRLKSRLAPQVITLTASGYIINNAFQFTSNPNAVTFSEGTTLEVEKFVSDGALIKVGDSLVHFYYDYYKN